MAGRLNLLAALFPDLRAICCIRPLPEVVDSFERLFDHNPLQTPLRMEASKGLNIYSRLDSMMGLTGVIGLAVNSLKQGLSGPHSHRMAVLPYATLAKTPAAAISELYKFLEEETFQHDFTTLQFDEPDYDLGLGLPGLHKVRPKVEYRSHPVRLPGDVVKRLRAADPWPAAAQDTKARLIGDKPAANPWSGWTFPTAAPPSEGMIG